MACCGPAAAESDPEAIVLEVAAQPVQQQNGEDVAKVAETEGAVQSDPALAPPAVGEDLCSCSDYVKGAEKSAPSPEQDERTEEAADPPMRTSSEVQFGEEVPPRALNREPDTFAAALSYARREEKEEAPPQVAGMVLQQNGQLQGEQPSAGDAVKDDFVKSRKNSIGTPAVFQHIKKGKAGSLNWTDICFSVKVANKKEKERKEILQHVSGNLRPGSLTCILGPSGSGKTTLLNTLSGRTHSGGRFKTEITGQVELNGLFVEPWQNQHLFGYVMQEDSLYATESPREILTFAAMLRLNVSAAEMMPLVDDMISSLGLTQCANTMAGSDIIKGISGGQKKRTSIAAELITNPAITFLDEPTSGLDTAAAYNVVTVLKELANADQSVMATVHQPSSEIFELFDSAIFIAQGQIIYQGPPSGIRSHFSALGHVCPTDYNPADFVMFTVEMTSDEKFNKLAAHWMKVEKTLARQVSEPWTELPSTSAGKGFFTELMLLSARQYRNTIRDKATLGGRFGLTIGLNIVFSVIFLGAGDKHKSGYSMQTHAGALTMAAINSMFGSVQPAILTFPSERPVFLREYASQMYGVIPYFLSKTVVEGVLLVFQMVFVVLILYWTVGFHGNFLIHVLAFFLVGFSSSSIGLLLGCAIPDIKTAMEVTPLAFVPQILFAGFFIEMEQVPIFLRWIQYVCGLKWGMNMVLANEFADEPEAKPMLEGNDVEDLQLFYAAVLVGLIVFFRSVSVLKLKSTAGSVYR